MFKKSNLRKFLHSSTFTYLVLTILVIALFGKAIFFKFTYLDDNVLLVQRVPFLNSFANIIKSFQEQVFYLGAGGSSYYRPVLNVFFILEYKLFGARYWGYHLFNIFVHLVNTFLVFRLLTKLKITKKVVVVSSILFAIHPTVTQAVAWVPGLNDLLLAGFFLGSLIYLVNYLKASNTKDLFFFLLFFALAVFTKESALAFIVVYFVFCLLYSQRNSKPKRELLILFISSVIVLGTFFYLRSKALQQVEPLSYVLLFKSALKNFTPAILVNLGKVFFPINLSVLPVLYKNNYMWGIFSVLILFLIVFISKRKKIGLILLGLTILIMTFLPTLVNPIPGEKLIVFEHRLYIPLIGVILILTASSLYEKYFIGKKLYILFLVAFFLISFRHIDNFKSPDAFWNSVGDDVLDVFPFAKGNLALVSIMDGNDTRAKELLMEMSKDARYTSFAYNNMGFIYAKEGNYDEATKILKEAIRVNPLSSNAYLNLGYIYKHNGDIAKAKDYFYFAVYSDPDNVDAMMNLASIYVDEGNMEKAQMIYDEVKKHGVSY